MKFFKTFRLDTANHLLYCNGDRVPLAPKPFDILAYLVEHAGRVVTQDEILQVLWSQTYVNPEILRKYVLEIRKVLGDRAEKPEFIETLPKRGYRFIAPVVEAEEDTFTPSDMTTPPVIEEHAAKGSKSALWNLVLLAILGIVAAAVTTSYLRHIHRGKHAASLSNISIAVLPFADTSPTKDQEYFSDGLAEQLINDLAKVPGLKVIGRSSAFQFKGSDEDARVVGRKLGVANILEGSVRRENNHLRITAELIKTDDGFQLWSQTYDQEINDIFAVQDEIALSATAALQVKLLGGNSRPFAADARGVNPEAYQAYLQAEYFRGRGQSKEDLGKALDYAGTAIKLDQSYAPAWALRASLLQTMAGLGMFDTTKGFHQAREDAERAIELNPVLGSAYLALAATQINYDWDWDAGEISINKAAALEPGSVEVFRVRSRLSRALGNLDRAIKLNEEAVALDPLRTNSHLSLGHLLFAAARYEDARAELKRALDLNPRAAYVHLTLGQIFLAQGKPREALAEFELEPVDWGKLMGPAMAYHELGRKQASDAALSELIAKHGTSSAYQIAQVYAFRGDPGKSFEWLDRAYTQRDAGLVTVKTEPLLESLHHDTRYTQLLSKMRLN